MNSVGIVISGGRLVDISSNTTKVHKDCWLYLVGSKQWRRVEMSSDIQLHSHSITNYKDNLYIFGGLDSSDIPQSTLYSISGITFFY